MKKLLGFIASLAVMVLFVACAGSGEPTAQSSDDTPAKAVSVASKTTAGVKVGDIAPDFNLKNIDGEMVSLASIKNADGTAPKGYIVTFTCNTCPYAVMYEDRLVELHNKYAPQGYPVVAIMPNDIEVKPGDSPAAMKKRAEDKGFSFAYLYDEGQKVYPQYGATKTPHIFLLDDTRKVRYIGAIDNNPQDASMVSKHYLEDAIAAVDAGNEPDPDFTKAVGCSIKVKK
ncbi:MAG: thioredoxin family protein [Bacteroidota bacterium]